jgi:1-acyl-sn-glycerol-3-phosphate acyltransferase
MREIKSRIDNRTRELEKIAQVEFDLPAPPPTPGISEPDDAALSAGDSHRTT